jgi:uncharacterized protein (DUF2236 family)
MPESLRRKLDLRWTSAQQTELRALGAASRALTPVLPAALRNMGPEFLRLRRKAIASGPLGPAADAKAARATAAAV